MKLDWTQKNRRTSKSIKYENRYTELTYNSTKEGVDELSNTSKDDSEVVNDIKWISYRQHFFSTILISDKQPFASATVNSANLVEDEDKKAQFTKQFKSSIDLETDKGEFDYNLKYYFGPTKLEVLKSYEGLELDDSIYFGWGIFGVINRYVFTPFYDFLSGFLPYGIAIILMTIVVRLLMSPVTYKSYLSQAKMKVLRPEIQAINDKR